MTLVTEETFELRKWYRSHNREFCLCKNYLYVREVFWGGEDGAAYSVEGYEWSDFGHRVRLDVSTREPTGGYDPTHIFHKRSFDSVEEIPA